MAGVGVSWARLSPPQRHKCGGYAPSRREKSMNDEVKQRKAEHVSVALGQDVSVPQRANWSDIQLVHQALPEVDLDEIDTAVDFLGRTLRYPIFMSSLTGGHPDVTAINRNLARA